MAAWDAGAWLATMERDYPVVTRANLERAFTERPELFGGGELIGSSRSHLRLPNGDIYDLVLDAYSRRSRWQVLFVDPNAPFVEDPFALEEGPLVELELPDIVSPAPETAFTTLVAHALIDLGASDDTLHRATTVLVTASAPNGLGDALQGDLDAARRAHEGERFMLDALRPEELVAATAGADGVADARPGMPDDADVEPPPDVAPGDPGPPPPDEGRPPEA